MLVLKPMVTTGDLPFQETPIQNNIFEQTGRHRKNKKTYLLIDDIDNDISRFIFLLLTFGC